MNNTPSAEFAENPPDGIFIAAKFHLLTLQINLLSLDHIHTSSIYLHPRELLPFWATLEINPLNLSTKEIPFTYNIKLHEKLSSFTNAHSTQY